MQTVWARFVLQAAATRGKNLPAVVFETAARIWEWSESICDLRPSAQDTG
jgi:hypothetical protein